MKAYRQSIQITVGAILAVLAEPEVRSHVPLGSLIGTHVWPRGGTEVYQHEPPRAFDKDVLGFDIVVQDGAVGPVIGILVK